MTSVSMPKLVHSVSVGAEAARAAIDAAIVEATALGKNLTIAVVDAGGELLAVHRMDGAVLVSIDSAIIKARTVIRTGVRTGMLQDMVHGGNLSVMLMPGTAAMGGGMPIVFDQRIIGAIAVSGDTVETDEQVCRAGIAAIVGEA